MAEKTEFEFPDEIEEKQSRLGSKVVEPEPETEVEDKVEDEIQIEDDVPEEDRGRKPMETPPEDPTDEELNAVSKKVRDRTREFHRAYHDERRAKEAALREREKAIELAKVVYQENQRLKGTVNQNQNVMLENAKAQVTAQLEAAKRKYKDAYETGDSDGLVAAQEELTSAKVKLERLSSIRPKPLQEERNEVQIDQTVNSVPAPDDKAVSWAKANPWFGPDKEMTGFALAVHDKLVNDMGLDPQSDEYYQRLNGRLRQVFPDKFESEEQAESSGSRKKSNVVASATRSTAPKKIVLSQSEVNIAKRLGIPLEQYAREVAKLRRGN
jgi:hypothetical protein